MGKDTKSDSGLPPAFDAGKTYLVKGSTLNMLTDSIRKNKPLAGKGVKLRQTSDGWVIDAESGGATAEHPFKLVTEAVGGIVYIRFMPGRLFDQDGGEVTVECNGEPMAAPDAHIEVPGDGAYVAYLRVEMLGSSENLGTTGAFYITDSIILISGDIMIGPSLPAAAPLELDPADGTYASREVDGFETEAGVFFFPIAEFTVSGASLTVNTQEMRADQATHHLLFDNVLLVPLP